jgi:Putative 2OG-Fe(II) oxygenase
MDGMSTRNKTRALKKYEAAPTAVSQDNGDPPLALYSPFGPLIARTEVGTDFVDRINQYADKHIRPDIGTEFLLPRELVFDGGKNSLMMQTEQLIRRYLRLVDEPADVKIRIDIFWIVSQYKGTPSPVHFHSGDISGVLYLKVPQLDHEEDEALKTYISGRQAGYINFLIGGKQRFSKSLISFRPHVGGFYIFPGWLLHGAEPFRGTGERRSLAFNAHVEAEPD